MADFVINGKYLTQRITGVQRYAAEVVRELDGLVEPGMVKLAVPTVCDIEVPAFEHIEIVRCGKHTGVRWEQFDFPEYVRSQRAVPVNLCNAAPFFAPGIVCVHDAFVRTMPKVFTRSFVIWYRLLLRAYEHKGLRFLTVSKFSQYELGRFYPRIARNLTVIPNGWQHMERIAADDRIFQREPRLRRREFFLSIGSAAKSKNFKWVLEVADNNPDCIFAVAGGGASGVLKDLELEPRSNVIRLGYVSDGELKALMQHCRAFLFPSLYEGFGVPPMEALACGATVVVSDIPVLREVYGDGVIYIDPLHADVDVNKLLEMNEVTPADSVLSRYSWHRSAEMLCEALSDMQRSISHGEEQSARVR